LVLRDKKVVGDVHCVFRALHLGINGESLLDLDFIPENSMFCVIL
jgi:hypothetical protein